MGTKAPNFMGNEEHRELLLSSIDKGVHVWNSVFRQRFADGTERLNLVGMDLRGLNLDEILLMGAHLDSASFRSVQLQHADLTGASLIGANLEGTSCQDTKFIEADVARANFQGAKLARANFQDAHAVETIFVNANITDGYFNSVNCKGAKLTRAIFRGATATDSRFVSCAMNVADFSRSDVSRSDFHHASLEEAVFRDACCHDTSFKQTNLKNVAAENLEGAGANFRSATMSGINLRRATLLNATFKNSKLYAATLQNGDFTGSRFPQAKLTQANCPGAIFDDIHAAGTIFREAKLRNASFRGANLERSDFREANLIETDLSGASLSKIRLYRTQYDSWKLDGVQCHSVNWSERGDQYTEYGEGQFEKLYGGVLIEIEYPGGIAIHEYMSVPAMVEALKQEFEGRCVLTFDSMRTTDSGKSVVLRATQIREGFNDEDVQKRVQAVTSELQSLHKQELARLGKALETSYKNKLSEKNRELAHKSETIVYTAESIFRSQKEKGLDAMGSPFAPEHRELAVFISDLSGFSKIEDPVSKRKAVLALRQGFSAVFMERKPVFQNSWGDAIVAGFEEPLDCIQAAVEVQEMFEGKHYSFRFGVDFGSVLVEFNPITRYKDGVGSTVDFAARLEPLCDPNRILVSPDATAQLIHLDAVQVEDAVVTLKKGAKGDGPGETIPCKYVTLATYDSNS
ncbi:MAG: pentapeptide repeat-containing protein [Gammaproteobacteria bacterium]|nr:pentapeptide repeat-containing protein [Gammaproteobacteria bacterium]